MEGERGMAEEGMAVHAPWFVKYIRPVLATTSIALETRVLSWPHGTYKAEGGMMTYVWSLAWHTAGATSL